MKLSVITINYNNKEGLEKTALSILSQDWEDYEWIVIDGGSDDGSKEIIAQHKENISYWCSEPDNGVYHAMNKAIARANGEYLIFMNSGDVFYNSNVLSSIFCKDHQEDILYGDWLEVHENAETIHKAPAPLDIYSIYQSNICQQAMFVKRTLLQEEGFDESYKIVGDWMRWIEALLNNATCKYLDCVICRYDMSGISSAKNNITKAEYDRVKRQMPIPIKQSLDKLWYYENYDYVQIPKALIERGGWASILTRAYLKIMYHLVLRKANKS